MILIRFINLKGRFEKASPSIIQKIEEFPATYQQTIQCKKLTEEDLLLKVATTKETVRCNVIQKQEIGTFTERITKEIPVENGLLQWQKPTAPY